MGTRDLTGGKQQGIRVAREKVSQEEKRGQRTGGLGSQHQDSGFSSDVEKSWGLRKSWDFKNSRIQSTCIRSITPTTISKTDHRGTRAETGRLV